MLSAAVHPSIETSKGVTSQDGSESWYALVWLFHAHHSIGLTFRNLMTPASLTLSLGPSAPVPSLGTSDGPGTSFGGYLFYMFAICSLG